MPLAILGTGRMGEALLAGLLRVGWTTPDQVRCSVRRPERAQELADTYGVQASTDSSEAIAGADVVLLAVKPQSLRGLLEEVGPKLTTYQTVISVAAGVRTRTIEDATGGGVPVVRVMSNTPVQVEQAMSVLAPGAHARAEDVEIARQVLGAVGQVISLPEEQLDAVTALSGSGPAYVFLMAEAMIDAGVLLGLARATATELTVQTLLGAAHMLADTGARPAELREAVASPGGTTIAALRALEDEGMRSALFAAIEAARERSVELSGD